MTSLARLVIGAALSEQYETLVYLDGDVQILRDPRALFEAHVPEGQILAAPGGAWLLAREGAPQFENMDDLGLDPEEALKKANAKFTRRFKAIEAELAKTGRRPEDSDLTEMDALWDAAKHAEKQA